MAIFSSLSTFFNKHKRKIFITTTVGISVYYAVNYFIIQKFKNFQNSLTQELFIKEQIKRRFIQTQNDCYYTLLSLLPVLIDPIINNSPIELITKALKLKKSNNNANNNNPKEISDSLLTTDNLILHSTNDNELSLYLSKSKTELWKLLKIKTLTRFLTLNYSISSLLLLTRLQLNILARKSYLQSAILMTNNNKSSSFFQLQLQQLSQSSPTDEEYFVEQTYLSLSWWLLNKGWESLNLTIENVITEKFKLINARTELTTEDFKNLLLDTIEQLNSNKTLIINALWPNFDNLNLTLLNVQPSIIDNYNETFIKLVNETNLILSNDFFINNLHNLIVTNIDTLIDNLNDNLSPSSVSSNNGVGVNTTTKLANLLAQLSIQCEILSNNNYENSNEELGGNQYINNLNNLDTLDDFSASIYSNIE